jgi:hypothetical protein
VIIVRLQRLLEATPLAVTFDVTVTRVRGTSEVTLVVRVAG